MNFLEMVKNTGAALVWEWENAPQEFRNLSPHGGDEDWVALVPDNIVNPSWAEDGTPFGCCDVSEHELGGARVLVGAHA